MARLIESSLWVDFTRKKSPVALKRLIEPWILDPSVALCEPVIFEILRHASELGQKCRDQGYNAGSLDLVIAAIALHHNAEIITFDADFAAISKAAPLRVQLLFRP
jgi:predicted nucleic acid-binding protein